MIKKRNRLEIIRDIIHTINKKNETKPTHILYKSNLSYQMMEGYLKELVAKKFIREKKGTRSKTYSITEKGKDYLGKYKLILNFTESFGLN